MVDSRAKGRQAELKCRDELRKLTGLKWERTPMSGALGAQHKLKGDLYVPETKINYCVEVKAYKDDHISTLLLTGSNPLFFKWWEQTVREAEQMEKDPLLIFKHNRSKWFAASSWLDLPIQMLEKEKILVLYPEEIAICTLTTFCNYASF